MSDTMDHLGQIDEDIFVPNIPTRILRDLILQAD
jgi:hypothetical protein